MDGVVDHRLSCACRKNPLTLREDMPPDPVEQERGRGPCPIPSTPIGDSLYGQRHDTSPDQTGTQCCAAEAASRQAEDQEDQMKSIDDFKTRLSRELSKILRDDIDVIQINPDSDGDERWEGTVNGVPELGTVMYSPEGSAAIMRDQLRTRIYSALGKLEFYEDYESYKP